MRYRRKLFSSRFGACRWFTGVIKCIDGNFLVVSSRLEPFRVTNGSWLSLSLGVDITNLVTCFSFLVFVWSLLLVLDVSQCTWNHNKKNDVTFYETNQGKFYKVALAMFMWLKYGVRWNRSTLNNGNPIPHIDFFQHKMTLIIKMWISVWYNHGDILDSG